MTGKDKNRHDFHLDLTPNQLGLRILIMHGIKDIMAENVRNKNISSSHSETLTPIKIRKAH